jgi:hypothetical protein
MNIDEKQNLLQAEGEKTPTADPRPSENTSSIMPLQRNLTPDLPIEEVVEDTTEYDWGDYDNYKIDTAGDEDIRTYEDIVAINKITRYYKKYLLEQKKDLGEKNELDAITKMLKHQKLFAEGKFTWEIAFPDMDPILTFAKTTISKFSTDFDFEMLDHSLFQKIFPLRMIDQYLSVVNRQYGKPVYDKALRFHTNLLEIFLWHHLNADTRFHTKITTVDINLIDPFLRIRIREKNRNDTFLKEKYFNPMFDIKKLVFKLLDLYFPNVTWRYIGGGQEMHRWTLLLMLQMFELGFFEAEEMQDLVNLLLQKLENLLVLEKRSYQDFKTSLVNYPKFCKTLKAYFYECKQIVAAICIQIAMLLNDQAFMDSYPLFNKNLKMTDNPEKGKVWNNAYFTNSSVGNILNRIMTTYLCNLTETEGLEKRTKMFSLLNDFVMLTMDIENDVNYVSAKVVNQTLLEYYLTTPSSADVEMAQSLSLKLQNLADQINFLNLNKKVSHTNAVVIQGLKDYLTVLGKIPDGEKKNYFKNLLGLYGIPIILLSMMSSIISSEFGKDLEGFCGLALLETCKQSTLNQVIATNERCMVHWHYLFEKRLLTGVILQTSIFEGNYHVFYVHRSMMTKLMDNLKSSIPDLWALKEEDCNTPQKWFDKFKQGVVFDKNDTELDKVVTFYVNCRFLCDLVSNKDIHYETKFHNLDIQEIVVGPLFNVLLPLITDENFLKKYEDGNNDLTKNLSPYIFRPGFKGASAGDLNVFVEKKTTHGINESELRCAVFEVAMLTMKLLNKACTGLYSNWIYKYHAKAEVTTILERTKFILDLPYCAAEYRLIVLQFYCNFRIFPNNSLLTARIIELKDPVIATKEERVPKNHKDGTLINEFIKELEHIDKWVHLWDNNPDERSEVIKYYYNGVFGMLYKYFKGIYCCYSQDDSLENLLTNIDKLKDAFEKIAPTLRNKFGINFDLGSVSNPLGGTNLISLMAGVNKVVPKPSSMERTSARFPDNDEKLYPKLAKVRDYCESFIETMEQSMTSHEHHDADDFLNFIGGRYSRPAAIYSSKINLEPWGHAGSTSSGANGNSKRQMKSKLESTLNLAKVLLASTGLVSSELRYYYCLMDIYQEEKIEALSKPVDGNIFLKFLESGDEYVKNLINFIGHLVQRFYGEKLLNSTAAPADDSKECYANFDFLVKTFLQHDVIYSMASFFSKVIAESNSIKDALYDALMAEKEEGKPKLTSNMLTILYAIAGLLQSIVLNKTFLDYEHEVITEKYQSVTLFFRNICENNCQKFKAYFGEFAPFCPALPIFNKAKKSLVFDSYVRMEQAYTGFNIHTTKDPRLRVDDKPECLHLMSLWIKMVSEFVNGPCLANQKQIYIYRTDFYSGTIRHMIDNIDSTFYHHKHMVVDYIDGLIEGNNEDIVKHFASNFTFDILFDLICDSIKRLYIYSTVQGKPDDYRKLVKEAREHKLKKDEEAKKKELALRGLLDQEMELYLYYEDGKKGEKAVESILVKTTTEEQGKGLMDYDNCRMITQEILDYVKVDDYNDIFQTYLRNNEFSKHIILSTVFKLNDFISRFSTIVAGFKISLDNVYHQLIDNYGDEVPSYIINKVGSYEPKEAKNKNEKLVLYMFLCKITSEIELFNPIINSSLKVAFPLIPKTFFLTESTKRELVNSADYSAMTMDLILSYKFLELEMNYNLNLYRSNPFLYRTTSDDFFFYVKFVMWLLAFALNILLIVFYRRDTQSSSIMDHGWYGIWAMSGIIGFVSITSMFMWFLSRYKQKVEIATAKWEQLKTIHDTKLKRFFNLYIKESMMKQMYPVLFTFYITCCLLGVFVQPFFFTLMVLTVVTLSTTMNYVVKAITTHFDQLSQTVFLMLMVIYCYSVLSAEYFFDKFTSNTAAPAYYYNCTQLWECVMYVFNYGLRMGGGIGDVTDALNPLDNEGIYTAKFFFDVAFFMMINVISLNIIFGIIIDTFADMRQKNDDRGSFFSL